jgi:hypothetical protein
MAKCWAMSAAKPRCERMPTPRHKPLQSGWRKRVTTGAGCNAADGDLTFVALIIKATV